MKHRPNVERAIAQVATWRGRRLKLRYRGVTRNHAWLKRRTAALNLQPDRPGTGSQGRGLGAGHLSRRQARPHSSAASRDRPAGRPAGTRPPGSCKTTSTAVGRRGQQRRDALWTPTETGPIQQAPS
jgi:hypothetical protein